MFCRISKFLGALLMVVGISIAPSADAAQAQQGLLLAKVHALLSAYGANDIEAVLRLVDPSGFTIYGSDASEIVTTVPQLRSLMSDDFQLWKTARFGEMRDVSVNLEGATGTVFFQAPFSAGGSPDIIVRFSTVWHRVRGDWRLVLSANTVPTVGSSAAEILRKSVVH